MGEEFKMIKKQKQKRNATLRHIFSMEIVPISREKKGR